MPTNFPTSYDDFTNPTAGDSQTSVPHDQQHSGANDAIEALQLKVGTTVEANATVHVSPDQPLKTGPYLWVQTGLGGSGTDFTFWIEDGE